jgi:hypothetical protein
MADKRKGSGSDTPRRARSAPTIDLTATELPDPAHETPAQEPSAGESEPAFAASEVAAPPPSELASAAPAQPAVEPSTSEPPPAPPPPEPPQAEAAPSDDLPPADEPRPARQPGLALPFAAGIVGGIVPAALLAALWYGGVLRPASAPGQSPQFVKTEQQVVALQNDVRSLQGQTKELQTRADNLQNRPAPAADTKATDALAQRVASLESAAKSPPQANGADPQLASRIDGLESTLKSNSSALAALTKQIAEAGSSGTQALRQAEALNTAMSQLASRVDDMAKQRPDGVTPAQLEALQKQVASLKQSADAAQKAIEQNSDASNRARLAIATSALRNAVLSHAPYQAELANAQALGTDAKQLAPLQRFAASGVPSDAQLADSLKRLLPALSHAATPQASGDFLERLRANAGRLVRVTPANAPAGDEPADVLTRLKLEADHADIAGALTDIQKLPASAQQQAADWIATVKARNEALNAARALSAETARALGQR